MTFHKDTAYIGGGLYRCDAPQGCKANLVTTLDILDSGWGRSYDTEGLNPGWKHFCPEHLQYAVVSKSIQPDLVNHPPHYTSHPSGVECIQVTEHMDFLLGNVVKYIWRNGLKDQVPSLVDLKKAQFYLNRKIENLEKQQP